MGFDLPNGSPIAKTEVEGDGVKIIHLFQNYFAPNGLWNLIPKEIL